MRMRSRWLALAVLSLLGSGSVAYGQHDPLAFTSLGTLNVTSGTLNINTDTVSMSGAATFNGLAAPQSNLRSIAVFTFSNIDIGPSVTVNITGSRALVLLSHGSASVLSDMANSISSANAVGGYTGGFGVNSYGQGPGGGAGYGNGFGGGFGGAGGSNTFGEQGGGLPYGNLFQALDGGSGGGTGANGGQGGGGGGAIEISAIGSVTTSRIRANGGDGVGGGGSGGGILLSGSTINSHGSLEVRGGNGATGGGGGRIALSGLNNYTIGTFYPINNIISGGNGSNPGSDGMVSIKANTTTIASGQSFTLNEQSVKATITSKVEAYISKDLVINSGGTATLGMDNALRRLDASGNNITALTVNGTFNTGAHSQNVSTLIGTGTVNLNSGGSLTVGENNASSSFSGAISGTGGLNKIGTGTLTLFGTSINYTGPTFIQNGYFQFAPESGTVSVDSSISGRGGIMMSGNGTLQLTGPNSYRGSTIISAGTIQPAGPDAISPESLVILNNAAGITLDARFFNVTTAGLQGGGDSGGTVRIGGTFTVAPITSGTLFSGLITGSGNFVKAGSNLQVLSGSNTWIGTTTVQQGNLQFNSPLNSPGGIVRVEGSGTLQANASITRPILGNGPGSTITVGASGITLGDATSFIGFNHQGILNIGSNNVTLASAAQPRLGSLTTLGAGGNSGTINSSKGVYVDFANALIGYGTVNSPNTLAERTIVNGIVQGNSTSQPITFTGWVKGVGTFNNVVFAGTWDPGFSPTLITAGSLGFSSTNNLIMELGGLSRGSQFDGIDATGIVNVAGTLSVARINGYSPNTGDAFVLVNRAGGSGTFIGLNEGDSFHGTDGGLYVISYQGINYMTNQLANGADGFSIVIAAVPEPTTWLLMGLGVTGGSWVGYRRLRKRTKALDTEVSTELD